MKEKRGPNNKENNGPVRSETRDRKLQEKKNNSLEEKNNVRRKPKAKEKNTKSSPEKPIRHNLVNGTRTGVDPTKIVGNMTGDDADGSEEANHSIKALKVDRNQGNENLNENASDMEIGNESDAETTDDSGSSLGDPQTADDEKEEKAIGGQIKHSKTKSSEKSKSESRSSNLHTRALKEAPKNMGKPGKGISTDNVKNIRVHPKPRSDSVAEADPNSVYSDDEEVNTEEKGVREDSSALDQKVEEMETKIKNLESELREVAALEISLYSVVPEHDISAQKVHTPARRLSRLYIYACKYWSQDKRATVARNTVTGLVLVSKSCGNDVSRLTFWLSNTVILREILSQAFGSSGQSSALTKVFESSGGGKSPPLKRKNTVGSRQSSKPSFSQVVDDWQETSTFTAALEKVESWLFSRIVESIWRQTLTPYMQSPVGDPIAKKGTQKAPAPALADQGEYSIKLWKNAFHDTLKRLCPIRAGGHECGCLLVMARKVMDQCIVRLDVAMFNAILRESALETPTDPVSDPIADSKVLPIPAGDLCFFSGAQLKNFVGNWTLWLSDYLDMDAPGYEQDEHKDDDDGVEEPKRFPLVSSLSDLLMLPKDMLMDLRLEVCPLISLPLIKRILCNFSPDDFCPDPVPITVLEAVHSECIKEQRLSGGSYVSFPFSASPIVYTRPSSYHVAKLVTEAGAHSQISRSLSGVQSKGYTSDEELEELESCIGSIIDKLPPSPSAVVSGAAEANVVYDGGNARYDLLREVWEAT